MQRVFKEKFDPPLAANGSKVWMLPEGPVCDQNIPESWKRCLIVRFDKNIYQNTILFMYMSKNSGALLGQHHLLLNEWSQCLHCPFTLYGPTTAQAQGHSGLVLSMLPFSIIQ